MRGTTFDPRAVDAFRICDWDFDPRRRVLRLRYAFEGGPGPERFVETVTFETEPRDPDRSRLDAWHRAVTHLHIAAGTSYYKAAAPERVVVETAALTLTAKQWQFAKRGRAKSGVLRRDADGDLVTRLVEGACIFLNRPGFPGGAGCALHRAALERGVEPLELKPDVCWQLPLRRVDEVATDGHVTSKITEWTRRDWGAGGQEFHWWCTEAPEAFSSQRPVFETMGAELVALCGEAVYAEVRRYLEARRSRPVRLTHPALRGRAAQ